MRFPVSFAQQRLWFLDQLTPGEPTFNMPYAIWLNGPVDPAALQRALDTLVARHAALRTSIVAVDGVPEQVVADTATVPLELGALPEEGAEALAADLALRPFDLARGPLLRAALIEVGPDRWLFVLVIHHIISDGTTMAILLFELSTLYSSSDELPALWMDYGDYAVWQRDRIRGEELERQLSYWREQLRGAPQVLELPTDRPRPAEQSSRGALAHAALAAPATRQLREVANGANVTMFMAFLTGFAVVLARYARQADLVIGTPVAGRIRVELEPIVGLFTNAIPLRIPLSGDPTFAELLGRVRDATVEALAHEELPFEKLVEDLRPDRSLGHAPLLQVQFSYQSLTIPELRLPGVTAQGRALFTGTAKLDLSLFADTAPSDESTLVLEYSTDLFDAPLAGRIVRSVATVLEHAAAAPHTPVADLPLQPAGERTGMIGPTPGETIDLRRLLAGSRSMITDATETVPMSEVCDRAARLARALAEQGVGPETRVGLCLNRGISMLTAMLAVWWAGGAYVPLDPDFPPARLDAMSRDAGLEIVLYDHDLRRESDAPARESDVPVPPDALAYTIFTSGSTGRPKGVDIGHRAVANLLASFRRTLDLGPGDTWVAVTTLSFDIALLELLLPPLCGADLVIATAEQAREADQLRALIEQSAATAMQATPQTWRMLLSAGGVPASLRLRLCGGETLPRDLADALGPGLWNCYGPTETTVWSAAGAVPDGPVLIGPAIDYTRVYIVDDRLVPVPVGVVGEVYLAGRGLARGYHGQPRRTAQAFRPDPWSDEPGARVYRTGDLARWREDGRLELIGRTDHQVKIRGFRIECGEIEAVLRAHRAIRQAVVICAPRAGEPTLVAYVVPRPGGPAAAPGVHLLELLRPHLKTSLPDYMIPALIHALPALPLTPNGKVDRAALPAPSWAARPTADQVAPRNPVEATMARIWAELLDTGVAVGIHDNLFDLGGHSLTATRFVARIADNYGVSLPVHHIFATPTIAELAELVSADPDFGHTSHDAKLAALSDDELDDLLRAALAARDRRRAAREETS
jgi:amino acid adenylation domain-containing protein